MLETLGVGRRERLDRERLSDGNVDSEWVRCSTQTFTLLV